LLGITALPEYTPIAISSSALCTPAILRITKMDTMFFILGCLVFGGVSSIAIRCLTNIATQLQRIATLLEERDKS
jgi:hypothetical protein